MSRSQIAPLTTLGSGLSDTISAHRVHVRPSVIVKQYGIDFLYQLFQVNLLEWARAVFCPTAEPIVLVPTWINPAISFSQPFWEEVINVLGPKSIEKFSATVFSPAEYWASFHLLKDKKRVFLTIRFSTTHFKQKAKKNDFQKRAEWCTTVCL